MFEPSGEEEKKRGAALRFCLRKFSSSLCHDLNPSLLPSLLPSLPPSSPPLGEGVLHADLSPSLPPFCLSLLPFFHPEVRDQLFVV